MSVDPMNEQAEVDGRIPGHRVPGHRAPARRQFDARHQPREHPVEAFGRDRRPAVAGQQASPLQDDLPGRRARRRSRDRCSRPPALRATSSPCASPAGLRAADGDLVDDLPAHRVVAAEPVGGAMPASLASVGARGPDRGPVGSLRCTPAGASPARSVGQTASTASGCSRSAAAKSSARFNPSKSSIVSSARPCSSHALQPKVAAAIRSAPIACPASCWQ